uniref:Uncharacterized protein n=1 Tax=Caenorhabditis japonica TaxID=281687 RepID=A0A8R1ET12_CAEJA
MTRRMRNRLQTALVCQAAVPITVAVIPVIYCTISIISGFHSQGTLLQKTNIQKKCFSSEQHRNVRFVYTWNSDNSDDDYGA